LAAHNIWRIAGNRPTSACVPHAKERRLPDGGQLFPALVLNADFRPLSYFPLSL